MKVPVSWLREYVDFDIPVAELTELMSMTGTKVEALHRRGVPSGLEFYRVGKVVTRDRHPDADRLSLCTVDVGEGEPRQIVCGATNFAAGDTVAVALPGAVLPDGTALRKAKLRGQVSDGMMLSERELELSNEHDGIMRLPQTWPVGDPLIDHLAIADDVIEFEITSNRPDCQNVYGIAREVSAVLDTDLAPWPGIEPEPTGAGSISDHVSARVDAPDLCPRWAARLFTDVKVGPSPEWLKARITAAGMRSISNVVDITNYVMLCLGEPTHAFDLDKVTGRGIIVRRATPGEHVTTLDGQDRTLDPDVLVIADAEKPSAIGGLMGSEWSEVTADTTTVLMECANFDGYSIQSSSVRLGLRTEGSSRWEKGIDPHLSPRALALASQLMVELAGATLMPGTIDLHGDLPEPAVLPLRRARLEQVIGMTYTDRQIERSLTRLGFTAADGGWSVPTWRAGDTTREIDLVEEVARVVGVEAVPTQLPPHADAIGRWGDDEQFRRHVVDVLCGAGLSESVTMSFWDDAMPARLRLPEGHPAATAVRVVNPMSADQTHLRTLVFPGLLTSLARNLSVGADSVALFEVAQVVLPADAPIPDQPHRIAGVMTGPGIEFADVRGVVETLYGALHLELAVERSTEPFLHPGRAAQCAAGFLGELHPLVGEAFGVEVPVVVFELDVNTLAAAQTSVVMHRDVTSFPPLRQDIAVVVADDVAAGDVIAAARAAGGSLLSRVEVFDVYRGDQIGAGKVSLALHLVFQSPDRTLTDAEADHARAEIVTALQSQYGAELRA
jgi:phenylalanyl-tRNA synthetase beta chain